MCAMFIHKVNDNEEEWLIEQELTAAMEAIRANYYVTWRSQHTKEDCMRIGSKSLCFCGHEYIGHKTKYPHGCKTCACKDYDYVPSRPEEVGDWWLIRRPDYRPGQWRAKCKCGHTHEQHHVERMKSRRCRKAGCGCGLWRSDFLCLVCDRHAEEHETVFEDAAERRSAGRSSGPDFLPLADAPELQHLVLVDGSPEALAQARQVLTAYAMGQRPGTLQSSGSGSRQGVGRLAALASAPPRPSLQGGKSRGGGRVGKGKGKRKGKGKGSRATVTQASTRANAGGSSRLPPSQSWM